MPPGEWQPRQPGCRHGTEPLKLEKIPKIIESNQFLTLLRA